MMKEYFKIKASQEKQIKMWWIPYILSGIKKHFKVNISFISPDGEERVIETLENEKSPIFEELKPKENKLKFPLTKEKQGFSFSPKKIISFFYFSRLKPKAFLKKKPKKKLAGRRQKAFKGYFVLYSSTWFPILIGSTYLGVLKISACLEEEKSQKIRSYLDRNLFESLQSFKS